MDTAGRERVRILVDSANAVRFEFLDGEGKVTFSLPNRTP
jgi:hypothetical protein